MISSRLRLHVRFENAIAWVAAHLLPRRLRRAVIVYAAVQAREPDRLAGDRYCGPDGLSYKDLWTAA